MKDYKILEDTFALDIYPKRNIVIVRGKGARVTDEQGNEYIDCAGGHGVASVGHCNESVIRAITGQANQLITCPGTFYNDTRARLFEKMAEIAPRGLTRFFLCNSGTEAVEAAIKFARATTKKTEFIYAVKGFHGRTMGALSATFNPKYKQDFLPLVPGFRPVPFNNFSRLHGAVNENTAGIILEPVQGEGGVYPGDKNYFQQVRQLCSEKNVLLIADEVQTGFCRTGRMFAIEHFDIEPDILCAAKTMAGGMPMGAVMCSNKIRVSMGSHGSTFGGNPLACAAALAAITFMIENGLAEQSEKKGSYLLTKLKELESNKIREIRGLGLMIGLELKEKVKPYIESLMNEGILTLPAGPTVLRLLPPLVIEYGDMDTVVEKMHAAFNGTRRGFPIASV